MRYDCTLSRWSPCRMTWLFLAVPPQAQTALSFLASLTRSVSLSLRPSIMVTARPHLRVSKRTRILCCSLLISPQTHMSRGSPHIGQISAIALILSMVWGLFKIFNSLRMYGLALVVCQVTLDRKSRAIGVVQLFRFWKPGFSHVVMHFFDELHEKSSRPTQALSASVKALSTMASNNEKIYDTKCVQFPLTW